MQTGVELLVLAQCTPESGTAGAGSMYFTTVKENQEWQVLAQCNPRQEQVRRRLQVQARCTSAQAPLKSHHFVPTQTKKRKKRSQRSAVVDTQTTRFCANLEPKWPRSVVVVVVCCCCCCFVVVVVSDTCESVCMCTSLSRGYPQRISAAWSTFRCNLEQANKVHPEFAGGLCACFGMPIAKVHVSKFGPALHLQPGELCTVDASVFFCFHQEN